MEHGLQEITVFLGCREIKHL